MPNSFPPIDKTTPHPYELEVSIFGSGVGECIVIHLGAGQWMIIDSCLNATSKQPVALEYLNSLGVDVASSVTLILVSHWHDDHIRGLNSIVEKCTSARVCYSAALLRREFLSLVSIFSGRLSLVDRNTSGTREITNVIKTLGKRVRNDGNYRISGMVPVVADKVLFETNEENCACTVRSLSPSDKSFEKALLSFSKLTPSEVDERVTLTNQKTQNNNAIAVWITFNNMKVLLGSDLEETKDPYVGWSAIIDSPVRPEGKADIFKIPHHGSPNGHHNKVWSEMVAGNDPISLITSYSKGKTPRPQLEDIDRIKEYTSNLFHTSPSRKKPPKRDSAVERTLRGMTIDRKILAGEVGQIQIRGQSNEAYQVHIKSPAKQM